MRRSPIRCCDARSLRSALAAAIFLLVPALALAQANGKLQIHHIDVGQGDGTLLISPNGQTALFDDGNYLNCTNIKSYLQGLGIATVNYHFCSHYHSDHLGCIDDLAAIGITIGTAGYDRGYSYSSGTYTSYVNTLGAKRTTIAKNQVITLDAGAANPVYLKAVDLNGAGVYSPTGSDENAKSLVMLVSYGSFNEVIGGDLTGSVANSNDVESTIGPEVGDVEVYKVHHHGSTYSSNDNWLNATTPEVGVIQVGNGNSYGHPTTGALGRLHAHGVHTYWNETGAGASPDPTWDKVANGTIVIQADPGGGAAYTVAGPGFSNTYYNDGAPPPITETLVASSITVLKGSITAGDYTRLASDDAVRVSISAGVSGGQYYTDWYGQVNLNHPALNLTVTYDGNFTVSRTQTLYLWNWATSVWDQINSSVVGTTDVTKTWSTGSPANYVSSGVQQVRFRVKGNNKPDGSYTSRGDYMAFTYDYTAGTLRAPQVELEPIAAVGDPAHGHDEETPVLPQSVLLRLEGRPADNGVVLAWSTSTTDHVDGFNVYRENAAGERVHLGNEALIELVSDEARFQFVDATNAGGVYWLGARSCSGPEGLIGPIRVSTSATAPAIAFAASPNPVRGSVARFQLTLERDADVQLDVYDLSGRRIATPHRGRLAAGQATIEWSLRQSNGTPAGPGLYFARLEALGRTQFTRVTVLGN
jgi:beta-lactamase superfamily II metal-dependent hydrolase